MMRLIPELRDDRSIALNETKLKVLEFGLVDRQTMNLLNEI